MSNSSMPPPADDPTNVISLIERLKSPYSSNEPPGGGMEARLARLEAHMEHLQSDLAGIKQDVGSIDGRLRSVETGMATLIERVAHLPGKGFIVSALAAMLSLIAALIAYQDQIKAFLG